MAYILSVNQLKEKLQNQDKLVIVDVRFQLTDEEAGRKMYLRNHLPGAVYLDLNRDLSAKPGKHGGNHPLPELNTFIGKLGNIGIDQDTEVVVYDQENDMFAPRLWWFLHHLGHDKVYVLEGGYQRWVQAGYEVTDEIPKLQAKRFVPRIQDEGTVTMEEVKENVSSQKAVLIDSREKDRYLGIKEPLYRKAGHIPGAIHYFWKDVFTEDGKWKMVGEIEKHFQNLDKSQDIIVSCGSGVSACPNILALKMAGYKNVKLYPGSFSDWISYDENEIEL
ncbi:sulfurtransferase [Oceanobacillus piezotolerans]|uniref:Sulfurtransferase n=1 Tax=Oceanobacillus piezotolerans TaxID=2448030 RepID=A0A498D7X6_9BACI|nr:sulfurtransferase [Oceanobacillus piezotolerans]RLL42057.1 sulfurtransferase [Oceanobacillus piezotolerans]